MKANTLTHHPLAILTARPQSHMAVLTADLNASDNDGWVQLLPAGKFKARDGRPNDTADGYWHLDKAGAEAMIAATKAIAPKVLIDYDHQTLRTEENGQPAPAAAWLNSDDIEWREGKGLYIRPDWTKKAQAHIDDKEYAFLSAVFPYDKYGRPLYLRMAAITNDPGLVGMESVAALAAELDIRISKPGATINLYGSTEDSVLNEALKKLLAKLGITVDGELTDELATAALNALDALQTKAGKADELEQKMAVLSANSEDHSSLEKAYNGVVAELAILKAGSDKTSLDAVIKTAREEGKIVEAEVEYLTGIGKQQGVAALTALLENRPVIAALKATQTSTTKVETETQDNKLDEQTMAILKATGLTKEQYLAQLKEDADE